MKVFTVLFLCLVLNRDLRNELVCTIVMFFLWFLYYQNAHVFDAISEILKHTFFLRIELQIATKFFAILHLNSGTFKIGCRVSSMVDQSLLDL